MCSSSACLPKNDVLSTCTDDHEHQPPNSSTASEGYASADEPIPPASPVSNGALRKRPSMDTIRRSREEFCPITFEQGEGMSRLFGPDCQFVSVSFAEFRDSVQLIEKLIERVHRSRSERFGSGGGPNSGRSAGRNRRKSRASQPRSPIQFLRRRRSSTTGPSNALKFFSTKSKKAVNVCKNPDEKLERDPFSSSSSTDSTGPDYKTLGGTVKRSKSVVATLSHSIVPENDDDDDDSNKEAKATMENPEKLVDVIQLEAAPMPGAKALFASRGASGWSLKKVAHKSSNVCTIS